MAAVTKSCSITQAFDFQKDSQDTVGYITKLKIGTQQLTQSLEVTNPTDFTQKIKCVGVLSSITWEGGYAQPFQFSCQVGTVNKNVVALLAHKDLSNTEVKVDFDVYDYDPIAKAYYKSLHCNATELTALVEKNGSSLSIAISEQAAPEPKSPLTYPMSLGIMPQTSAEQAIHIAVSSTDKLAKGWGVKSS